MVQGLRPEMLSVVVKIKGGNQDTSPATGVLLVELRQRWRKESEALKVKTNSLHSPSG